MKTIVRCMISLLLAVILVMSVTITASAAAPSITYMAKGDIRFAPGSGYTATDLFNDFKNVMPGDTIQEKITIKNEANDSHYIKVYLQAIPHDEEDNPLTYDAAYENTDGKNESGVDSQRDENVVTMNDFLSQLSVSVKNEEDEVLYTGTTEGPIEPVLLTENLSRGNSVDLTVELYVPIELGNEYANRVGEVDWKIKIEAYTNSGSGGGGGGGDITEEMIPDEDVPLAPPSIPSDDPLEEIGEKEPPLAWLPQTGLLKWPVLVMCAAGVLLIASGLLSEQKRKSQNK